MYKNLAKGIFYNILSYKRIKMWFYCGFEQNKCHETDFSAGGQYIAHPTKRLTAGICANRDSNYIFVNKIHGQLR